MATQNKKLTAKEETAVKCYSNPGSETYNNWCESYKKANYSLCTGWQSNAIRVLHKDHVQAAITEKRAEIAEKIDVTCEEIIKGLRKLAGLDVGAAKLNNAERIRSLELLGRYLGIFEKDNKQKQPQLNQVIVNSVQQQLKALDDKKKLLEQLDGENMAVAEG